MYIIFSSFNLKNRTVDSIQTDEDHMEVCSGAGLSWVPPVLHPQDSY